MITKKQYIIIASYIFVISTSLLASKDPLQAIRESQERMQRESEAALKRSSENLHRERAKQEEARKQEELRKQEAARKLR